MTDVRRRSRVRRWSAAATRTLPVTLVLIVVACTTTEQPPEQRVARGNTSDPVPVSPRDTSGMLAEMARAVRTIERDTAGMEVTQRPVALGAGTHGLVTGWRTGPVWRRLRVENEGPQFTSVDDYWLSNGAFLGATLTVHRPKQRAAIDSVWFRNGSLYRWTDAAGRTLNPDARSTKYLVQMLQARRDTLLQILSANDAVRQPQR